MSRDIKKSRYFQRKREKALGDGELIDVTDSAWTVGFQHPVALGAGLWVKHIYFPTLRPNRPSIERLTWDFVSALHTAMNSRTVLDSWNYTLSLRTWAGGFVDVQVRVVRSVDDRGDILLTVMRPDGQLGASTHRRLGYFLSRFSQHMKSQIKKDLSRFRF